MARRLREKSGTGIYHVMLRGINRQDIFEDEEDYMQMTSILRGQSERYDEQRLRLPPFCLFYAYCLMSNHLHLLVQEREENVSEVMKRVGVTYAHYFGITGSVLLIIFRNERNENGSDEKLQSR
jgi:REP element-mobilizing transposase RayT